MKITIPKLRFLVSMIYDLLLEEERVLVVYNFPVTLTHAQDLEDVIGRKLVNFHPKLTTPFQLITTPTGSTVEETLRLLTWHPRGIVFIDYDSYRNLRKKRTLNTQDLSGAQIHLFKTGRIAVYGAQASVRTGNRR